MEHEEEEDWWESWVLPIYCRTSYPDLVNPFQKKVYSPKNNYDRHIK